MQNLKRVASYLLGMSFSFFYSMRALVCKAMCKSGGRHMTLTWHLAHLKHRLVQSKKRKKLDSMVKCKLLVRISSPFRSMCCSIIIVYTCLLYHHKQHPKATFVIPPGFNIILSIFSRRRIFAVSWVILKLFTTYISDLSLVNCYSFVQRAPSSVATQGSKTYQHNSIKIF